MSPFSVSLQHLLRFDRVSTEAPVRRKLPRLPFVSLSNPRQEYLSNDTGPPYADDYWRETVDIQHAVECSNNFRLCLLFLE